MTVPILGLATYWECPNCTFEDVTNEPRIHSRLHKCRGLKGLTSPMVVKGTKAKIEAMVREDYVGKEEVQYDGDGKPIMSVVVTRDEGQDTAILAPTARASSKEL